MALTIGEISELYKKYGILEYCDEQKENVPAFSFCIKDSMLCDIIIKLEQELQDYKNPESDIDIT